MAAKGWILIVLLAVGGGAVAARAALSDDGPELAPGMASSLTGAAQSVESSAGSDPTHDFEVVLPYVTEASLFAIVGFALGYLSRKVVKVGLILLGLTFVLLQTLSYLEVVSIDWTRATELINTFVLNWNTEQPVSEILKDRIPSAGGLVAGYALGFRRG